MVRHYRDTLSFLSLFLGKKARKPPKKQGVFHPYQTPKIPGKEGEAAQKNKEFLARENNKEFERKKK